MINSGSAKNEWYSIKKFAINAVACPIYRAKSRVLLISAVVVLPGRGGDLQDLQEFTFGTVNFFS